MRLEAVALFLVAGYWSGQADAPCHMTTLASCSPYPESGSGKYSYHPKCKGEGVPKVCEDGALAGDLHLELGDAFHLKITDLNNHPYIHVTF